MLRMPKAWPLRLRKPLPESPGMPGVSVYTVCCQPPLSDPTLTPVFGLSGGTGRSDELP